MNVFNLTLDHIYFLKNKKLDGGTNDANGDIFWVPPDFLNKLGYQNLQFVIVRVPFEGFTLNFIWDGMGSYAIIPSQI